MNRRLRYLVTTLATAAVVAGSVVFGVGSGSAATEGTIAACEYRVCLLVLRADYDSDGDGVTDVDEVALGTDPFDPDSHPGAAQLLDNLLEDRLPSFERHFTEIVVLPKLTPDGTEVATGLGAFQLRDGDAKILSSLWQGISGLRSNGFDPSKGITANLPPQPLSVEKVEPLLGPYAEMALVSAGSNLCCATSGGVNSGKPVEHTTKGNPETGAKEVSKDGDFTVRDYTATYVDHSSDHVTSVSDANGSHVHVDSYDDKGNKVETTDIDITVKDNGDGTTTTTKVTTVENSDGKTRVTKTQQNGNGETTTVVTREKYDSDGELVEAKTSVTTGPEVEGPCQGKTICEDNGDLVDPDYVGPGPITEADMERVKNRLDAVRRPVTDWGQMDPPITDPTQTVRGPVPFPWIALIDSEAIVTMAARETPVFNHVMPDYDHWLTLMSGISGQPLPTTDGDGHVTWPS
ncbi:MAG TPA: thrombospondin type 3 repeat-containing protein [Micromonosporaceae bacterium]